MLSLGWSLSKITAGLAISEQIASPFSAARCLVSVMTSCPGHVNINICADDSEVGASLAVKHAFADLAGSGRVEFRNFFDCSSASVQTAR